MTAGHGDDAICSAISIAASSAPPAGTTRFTSPIRQRLVGVDLASREDEIERAAEPDDARKAHGAAVDEWHAVAAFEAPEAGGCARDA